MSLSSQVTQSVSKILIRWIVVYPVDSAIQRLNNRVVGSTSDWSCIDGNLIQQIRSTTQIWVATCHQYGISAAVPQISFCWETSGDVANVDCFLRLAQYTWWNVSYFCLNSSASDFYSAVHCWVKSAGFFLVNKPAFSPVEIVLTVYYQQPFHALPDEL